jgi:hypothetical protein
MGKNSKRLNLKVRFSNNVVKVISRNRIILIGLEMDLVYDTKHTLFNNLYAEVIVNYKLSKL